MQPKHSLNMRNTFYLYSFIILTISAPIYIFLINTFPSIAPLILNTLPFTLPFIFYFFYTVFISQPLPLPHQHLTPIMDIIALNDLSTFTSYLSSHNLSVQQLSLTPYPGNTSLLLYAIYKDAYDIFTYLVDNGIDLNYSSPKVEAPIIFAAYYGKKKYMRYLLKHAHKVDMNVRSVKLQVNAMEIAVWRGRKGIAEMLLECGMEFSIKKYNESYIGKKLMTFDKVDIAVKKVLVKYALFKKKVNCFIVNEKMVGMRSDSGKNVNVNVLEIKPFIMENLLLNS